MILKIIYTRLRVINMNNNTTPDVLLPALRQYQHNDCSGLVAGFDIDETIEIVVSLQVKLAAAEEALEGARSSKKLLCGLVRDLRSQLRLEQDRP